MSVLIVDDDPLVRQVLAGQLSKLGHAVLTAVDGHDAMRVIDVERPEVILTDFNMTPLGGWPWVRYLLELADEHRCRVVVMTGESGEKEVPVPLLKKPFTAEQLQQAITGTGADSVGRL